MYYFLTLLFHFYKIVNHCHNLLVNWHKNRRHSGKHNNKVINLQQKSEDWLYECCCVTPNPRHSDTTVQRWVVRCFSQGLADALLLYA